MCLDCSEYCTECTSGSKCQACAEGYGLYDSVCGTCPAGTYLSDEAVCEGNN